MYMGLGNAVAIAAILFCQIALAAPLDTLRRDDNVPAVAFKFPDAFGDDLRNLRFQVPASCTLSGAMFALPTRNMAQYSTGDPSLVVMAWQMGQDSLPDPDAVLLRDTTVFSNFEASLFSLDSTWRGQPNNFVIVDLSDHGIELDSGAWFHLGYSAVFNSPDDSLAILSDDGSPSTSYASEWYDGRFVLMREGWMVGVNFFIRAIVDLHTAETMVLSSGQPPTAFTLNPSYPNPFNPSTTLSFQLPATDFVSLTIYDLLGRKTALVHSGLLSGGYHSFAVDGSPWASGVYFARLQVGEAQQVVSLILEK
jgi:hypothetical protein